MTIYAQLPYLEVNDLPAVGYEKGNKIREPLRHAINAARALPDNRMEQIETLLEEALKHIRSAREEELDEQLAEVLSTGSDDPLDLLLGPATAQDGGDAG